MVTIEYDPNSDINEISLKDGEIYLFADQVQNNIKESTTNIEYIVTNFLAIMELRARIAEKKIDWTKIQFSYKGNIIPHNEQAKMQHWPAGFGDAYDLILDRLLLW